MKIIRPRTYNITDPALKRFHEDLYRVFNRNISFGQGINTNDQNIDGKMVEIADTGAVNTQFTVTHNLNRVPKFYDIKYISVNGTIYDSGTLWTKTQIFLKCSAANARIRIFVH